MSIFDNLLSNPLGLVGDLFSGYSAYKGQQEANQTNRQIAADNTAFQERMSNTAYQRQVKDMEAAGLNPMLAYTKGGGASTPSGSIATVSNPSASAVSAYHSSASARESQARTQTESKRPAQVVAQTRETESKIPLNEAHVDKVAQEINNLKTENDKAKALILNIHQEGQNLLKQNWNLTEVGNHLRKSIELMGDQINNFHAITANTNVLTEINRIEEQLKRLDLSSAQKFDNFGRDAAQMKMFLEVFKAIVRPR